MDIRQYMEAEGCGLIEAKLAVTKINKIERLQGIGALVMAAQDLFELRQAVCFALNEMIIEAGNS